MVEWARPSKLVAPAAHATAGSHIDHKHHPAYLDDELGAIAARSVWCCGRLARGPDREAVPRATAPGVTQHADLAIAARCPSLARAAAARRGRCPARRGRRRLAKPVPLTRRPDITEHSCAGANAIS